MKYENKKLGRYLQGVVPLHRSSPKSPKIKNKHLFKEIIVRKQDTTCSKCEKELLAGSKARWYYVSKKITCRGCAP